MNPAFLRFALGKPRALPKSTNIKQRMNADTKICVHPPFVYCPGHHKALRRSVLMRSLQAFALQCRQLLGHAPIRRLLIRMTNLTEQRLFKMAPNKLQADRQTLAIKSTGQR